MTKTSSMVRNPVVGIFTGTSFLGNPAQEVAYKITVWHEAGTGESTEVEVRKPAEEAAKVAAAHKEWAERPHDPGDQEAESDDEADPYLYLYGDSLKDKKLGFKLDGSTEGTLMLEPKDRKWQAKFDLTKIKEEKDRPYLSNVPLLTKEAE